MDEATSGKVRLDKWLWAARFFKTRSLAKQAIEKGQVLVAGQRAKPGREIGVGVELQVRQGLDLRTVTVLQLSDMRGPAPVAQLLYVESEASQQARLLKAEQRRAAHDAAPAQRPSKKQRRQLLDWLDGPGA